MTMWQVARLSHPLARTQTLILKTNWDSESNVLRAICILNSLPCLEGKDLIHSSLNIPMAHRAIPGSW